MTTDLAPIYTIAVDDHEGVPATLAEHRGHVLMIVNTASY
jgi:glutathione peroxidase-family protein